MANPITVEPRKGRMTSLISASVLVTGLLLMAFVSGVSGSESPATASAVHATH